MEWTIGHAVAWCVATGGSPSSESKKTDGKTMPNMLGLETKLFTTVSS